jgi:hypothetical protein
VFSIAIVCIALAFLFYHDGGESFWLNVFIAFLLISILALSAYNLMRLWRSGNKSLFYKRLAIQACLILVVIVSVTLFNLYLSS